MKKYIVESLLIASAGSFLAACDAYHTTVDNAQIKEDVRRLLNDIDDGGDLDKYLCGSDYVERLYDWSHNK